MSSFHGLVVKRSNSSVLRPGHFPFSWDKFNPHIWTLPLNSCVNAATTAETRPLTFKEELDIRQGRKKPVDQNSLTVRSTRSCPPLAAPSLPHQNQLENWLVGMAERAKRRARRAEPLSPKDQSDSTVSGGPHQCCVHQESVDKSNNRQRNTVRTSTPEVHLP